MIDLIRTERQTVEAGPALPAIVEADCAYLDFFIELFEDAAQSLDTIEAEMAATSAYPRHAEGLRAIADRATEGRRRCLEFFDSISLDIRNQLVSLQELSGLAELPGLFPFGPNDLSQQAAVLLTGGHARFRKQLRHGRDSRLRRRIGHLAKPCLPGLSRLT